MKKRNNSRYLILVCCCSIALTGGCKKKDASPPQSSPPPVQHHKPAATPTVPLQGQMSTAQEAVTVAPALDVSSRKDPFRPYVIEQKVARPLHRASADALPIQQYEVRQFRVSGIIVGLKENRAQIIDPAGKAYVVHVGMHIGSNDGKIVKISASGIEVIELYREDNGRIVRKIIKLTLPKKG